MCVRGALNLRPKCQVSTQVVASALIVLFVFNMSSITAECNSQLCWERTKCRVQTLYCWISLSWKQTILGMHLCSVLSQRCPLSRSIMMLDMLNTKSGHNDLGQPCESKAKWGYAYQPSSSSNYLNYFWTDFDNLYGIWIWYLAKYAAQHKKTQQLKSQTELSSWISLGAQFVEHLELNLQLNCN